LIVFERTRDYALVRAILTHPAIWPWIGDDFAPPIDQWQPVEDERIWYVVARERGGLLGLFLFLPQSAVCWECHVSMLPEAWGGGALRAGREVIPWLAAHTGCRRLVAQIAASNPRAIRYAEACGFTRFGINSKSFMKSGKLEDQVLLGLSPEDSI
jgi:RimJ/RimL family protein N-acetyltransferase